VSVKTRVRFRHDELEFSFCAGGLEELFDDPGITVGEDQLAGVDMLLGALANHSHVVDLFEGRK